MNLGCCIVLNLLSLPHLNRQKHRLHEMSNYGLFPHSDSMLFDLMSLKVGHRGVFICNVLAGSSVLGTPCCSDCAHN